MPKPVPLMAVVELPKVTSSTVFPVPRVRAPPPLLPMEMAPPVPLFGPPRVTVPPETPKLPVTFAGCVVPKVMVLPLSRPSSVWFALKVKATPPFSVLRL